MYFVSLVQGFIFFMAVLLTGNSTPVVFLGWEGIGIMSFMLIAFWQTRVLASQAAMHGFVINRAGDLFFILVLVGLVSSYTTVYLTPTVGFESATRPYISLILLGGAAGKSAQLGLHS